MSGADEASGKSVTGRVYVVVGGTLLTYRAYQATDPGGGGGTASLRVGTQNKTTDPQFCASTALSHCPCWFTAPCF